MNRYSKWMIPIVLVLVCSTAGFAQSNRLNNRLENRAGHQEGKTEQGEEPGQSSREGRRVERLGAWLNNVTRSKVDGNVTTESGSRLNPPSNQAGKKIDRLNQNTQTPPASR